MINSKILGVYIDAGWDNVLANLGDSFQTHTPSVTEWPAWETDNTEKIGMKEVFDNWKKGNFNLKTIKWNNYYPYDNFSIDITTKLAEHLGLNGVHRSWISSIEPGFMAPWHYDYDDKEQEYLTKGTPKRFTCFISKPASGHIFILGEDYHFNNPQGTLVEWDNYKEWHSGINAGMITKYQFHLIGY